MHERKVKINNLPKRRSSIIINPKNLAMKGVVSFIDDRIDS